MSSDKFGRHRNKVQANAAFRRIQSRQNSTITITSNGNVNVNGKRIRFVGDATHIEDCINKRCLNESEKMLHAKMMNESSTLHNKLSNQIESLGDDVYNKIKTLDNACTTTLTKINTLENDVHNKIETSNKFKDIESLLQNKIESCETKLSKLINDRYNDLDDEILNKVKALFANVLLQYEPWTKVKIFINTEISKLHNEIDELTARVNHFKLDSTRLQKKVVKDII